MIEANFDLHSSKTLTTGKRIPTGSQCQDALAARTVNLLSRSKSANLSTRHVTAAKEILISSSTNYHVSVIYNPTSDLGPRTLNMTPSMAYQRRIGACELEGELTLCDGTLLDYSVERILPDIKEYRIGETENTVRMGCQ